MDLKLYKNKEEAKTALETKLKENPLYNEAKNLVINKDNARSYIDLLVNSFYDFLLYDTKGKSITLDLDNNIYITRYTDDNGKVKCATVRDLINVELSDAEIYNICVELDDKKVEGEYYRQKSYVSSFLSCKISKLIISGRFYDALCELKKIFKKYKTVSYNFYNRRSYNDDEVSSLRFFAILLYAGADIEGGEKYKNYILEYLNAIKDMPNLLESVLKDSTLAHCHNKLISKNLKLVEKNERKHFREMIINARYSSESSELDSNLIFNLDIIETNPALLEEILDTISFSSDPYYFSWYDIGDSSDRRIVSLKKNINNDIERFTNVLKNYFYSKYGRGSKVAGLEERIKKAHRLIDLLGFSDDISTFDIVIDLPDKVRNAALAAELGE